MNRYEVVVMGASWGGLRALECILGGLPGDFPIPVAVAQHRDVDAEEDLLPRLLRRHTELDVRDAEAGACLRPGCVLLAPAGYHLMLEDGGVELSVDAPVQFARPSIDVLFESAADGYGRSVIGVLLTGSNADGAAGMAAIARRGGRTIVEDPASAERPEMPRAALQAMTPDAVVALEDVAGAICDAAGVGAA
jgi:two-component system, chemotaxis family, protein-glutamate methylesterase/glutaminase